MQSQDNNIAPISEQTITDLSEPTKTYKPPFLKILIIILTFLVIGIIGLFGVQYYLNFQSSDRSRIESSVSPEVSPETTPEITQQQKTEYQPPERISAAHNQFGFDILQNLVASEDKNNNIFISPSSIALALSMTYNGAAKDTKKAMAETMHIAGFDLEELNKASNSLTSHLPSVDPNVKISIANSIWARENVFFNQDFLDVNKKYYQAQIQSLDFASPDAVDIINSWVLQSTKGKIPSIVSSPIGNDVVMYLINAIYFNGTWTYEFDKSLTQERQFTLSDESKINHPLMKQKREDFVYLENDYFQAVNLPYGKNKKLTMYVFLPKDNVDELINQLDINNWERWRGEFKKMEGTLLLPKFKIEYDKELKDTLINLGMGIAFSIGANFSNMRVENDIMISKVKHKTYIDVDEEGTEAAAATSVEMIFKSAGPIEKDMFYMEVNKPFLYTIVDNLSGEILFMGVIKEPKL